MLSQEWLAGCFEVLQCHSAMYLKLNFFFFIFYYFFFMFEFFTLTGQSLPSLFVAFTRGKAVGGISSKYFRYYFKSCQWVGNDGKSQKNLVASTFHVANQGPTYRFLRQVGSHAHAQAHTQVSLFVQFITLTKSYSFHIVLSLLYMRNFSLKDFSLKIIYRKFKTLNVKCF